MKYYARIESRIEPPDVDSLHHRMKHVVKAYDAIGFYLHTGRGYSLSEACEDLVANINAMKKYDKFKYIKLFTEMDFDVLQEHHRLYPVHED